MDRLSIVLTLAVGAAITGSLVTLVLALGLYSWTAILVAAVAGFALSWPVSFAISRKIKQRDPNWDERRIERTETIPKPNAPEV